MICFLASLFLINSPSFEPNFLALISYIFKISNKRGFLKRVFLLSGPVLYVPLYNTGVRCSMLLWRNNGEL